MSPFSRVFRISPLRDAENELANLRRDAERLKKEREKEKSGFKDTIRLLKNRIVTNIESFAEVKQKILEAQVKEKDVIESERDDFKKKLDDLMSRFEALRKVWKFLPFCSGFC